MEQAECKRLWDDLKREVRIQIRQIDAQTEWAAVEPEWWLQMMRVYKEVNEEAQP